MILTSAFSDMTARSQNNAAHMNTKREREHSVCRSMSLIVLIYIVAVVGFTVGPC